MESLVQTKLIGNANLGTCGFWTCEVAWKCFSLVLVIAGLLM
jgi:hypothetical protein